MEQVVEEEEEQEEEEEGGRKKHKRRDRGRLPGSGERGFGVVPPCRCAVPLVLGKVK